jgi:hypothetical protein
MALKEYLWSKVRLSSGPAPSSGQFPSLPMGPRSVTRSMGMGVACAFIGLFIFPEIFASAGIILGAYSWKKQEGNSGFYIMLFALACMLIGLYFTAYILADLLPS